jgi:hypothetical protein
MAIYYHKHHIIPKHMGGTDEPENIVEITIEEHANIHKQLWEDLGHWQDEVAYRMLSGQISAYEATIQAIKKTQTGRKHSEKERKIRSEYAKNRKWSEETKLKISLSNTGKKLSEETKRKIGSVHKGKTLSDEHREIMRLTHLSKPKTEEQKRKMSESAKETWRKRHLRKES